MKISFKNSTAYRTFNLALRVEKFAKDFKKVSDIKKIEKVASFQLWIEEEVDKLHRNIRKTETELKGESIE